MPTVHEFNRYRGFKLGELNTIERELNAIVEALCAEWESIHGQP